MDQGCSLGILSIMHLTGGYESSCFSQHGDEAEEGPLLSSGISLRTKHFPMQRKESCMKSFHKLKVRRLEI